jgi:16S rRNA (uracil1498-N3)-methyltransferase
LNVLLFDAADEVAPGVVRVADRRLRHAREVLRAEPGDELAVGRIGGQLGRGKVVRIDGDALELAVALDRDPPPPHPASLALALPRPPSLRKVLQQATALGVKRFLLFASARVEKSYWQSSGLRPDALREQLWLGLEQSGDCALPEIESAPRFRDFAERALPALARGAPILVAHPGGAALGLADAGRSCALVVGPEGGFVPRELEALAAAGARTLGLGPRPLRVETAVVALLARLG